MKSWDQILDIISSMVVEVQIRCRAVSTPCFWEYTVLDSMDIARIGQRQPTVKQCPAWAGLSGLHSTWRAQAGR